MIKRILELCDEKGMNINTGTDKAVDCGYHLTTGARLAAALRLMHSALSRKPITVRYMMTNISMASANAR